MSNNFDWETTLRTFGSLFEKPRMTEALLRKPPFRFLLDVFAQTIKVTGYARGLYSEEELSSSFYDSREKKIIFLRKMKLLTEALVREKIQVDLGKIVAGLEPEKTNFFLQTVYRAATCGEDSAPFVKEVHEKLGREIRDAVVQPAGEEVESSVKGRGIVIPRRERPVRIEPSASKDDVETIKKIVQDLTHNVNPIRSSMDLIPDDIESMNKEMKLWRNNFVDAKLQYEDEQAKTEELLQALLTKVNELEELKRHQKSKIQAVKSNIIQNEERIQQLLFASVAK